MTHRTGRSGKDDKESGDNLKRIVDFKQKRDQKLEEKRKHTERIFFKNLISVYSMTGGSGRAGRQKMQGIELIDVSEEGCSFQIPVDPTGNPLITSDEIPVRLYFSRETYLEILVRIQNSRPGIENGKRFVRYGCTVDRNTKSYEAYQLFVKFLKLYAEHSHKDMGDVTVFYL